jgi:hypothetical protein
MDLDETRSRVDLLVRLRVIRGNINAACRMRSLCRAHFASVSLFDDANRHPGRAAIAANR